MTKKWYRYFHKLNRLNLSNNFHILEITGLDFNRFTPLYIDTLIVKRGLKRQRESR